MTDQEIVDSINKMFPAENNRYPVAFIVDGKPMVTSESWTTDLITQLVNLHWYDSEFDCSAYNHNGISLKLADWLENNNLYCDWEHAGGVHIYRKKVS